MAKTERVNARISAENKNKLMEYVKKNKHKGMTVSRWITERIELMRTK